MHIFMNAEKEDLRDSYTVLICKYSCLRRHKTVEKLAWNIRVPLLFQKNMQVDMDIILNFADASIEHIKDKYNGL